MAKIAATYASLLRGVSQQPPEVRQAGQHSEQVNLIPDPVAGLTRRHGSVKRRELDYADVTSPQAALMFATANGYRVHEHTAAKKDYMILIREVGTANTLANSLPPLIVYNKTDNTFKTILGMSLAGLQANGCAAITSVGAFVTFAIKNTPCVTLTTNVWPSGTINCGVIWVKGGAYDRTYKIIYAGGISTIAYTTPAPTVAGAASTISPQNIAAQLAAGLNAVSPGSATQIGSHIFWTAPFAGPLSVTDGGDGSLITGLYNDVEDVSKLTLMGQNGQVVRVGAAPGIPGFYVQAGTKDGGTFGECIWRETGTSVRGAPSNVFVMEFTSVASFVNVGTWGSVIGTPSWQPSRAGDLESNPTPRWMNNQITYMGMFQDRLLIGSDSALSVSGAGDYLNPFRSTVTTVPLGDGFEMIAQGSEDDVLRYGVPYNRNLVIFGDQRQYLISGSQPLTPTSANMTIMTVYANATGVAPIAAGGQIYYARDRDGFVAVNQIQPGTYVDSAESFPASAQISSYIPSSLNGLTAIAGSPARLVLRSRAQQRNLYVFTYLDQPDGRKQDAWDRWEYGAECGVLLGISPIPDGMIMIWARTSKNKMWIVADYQSFSTQLSSSAYMDSIRTFTEVDFLGSPISYTSTGWVAAYNDQSIRYLIGDDLNKSVAMNAQYPTETLKFEVGVPFESAVTLTNPYQRDGAGKAILSGRTIITRLLCSLKQTSGMVATIISGNATQVYNFNGRILGNPLNRIGRVPVSDDAHSVSIGRETREYIAKLASKVWYPFTLIGVEWVGQAYNRTPRAQQ